MTDKMRHRRERYGSDFPRKTGLGLENKSSPAVLDLRLRYLEEMGWLGVGRVSDEDRYDEDETGTIHISHQASDNEVVAAMRLTPVVDFEQGLSFQEMIGSDRAYQASVRESLAWQAEQQSVDARVWDLTRLVHDTSRERSGQVLPAFLGMFGAGLAATATDSAIDRDTWWVFITTDRIRRTLLACGIEFDDLGQSTDSSDRGGSYCCLVKPVEAMSRLQTNPQKAAVYKMIKSGFDEIVGIE